MDRIKSLITLSLLLLALMLPNIQAKAGPPSNLSYDYPPVDGHMPMFVMLDGIFYTLESGNDGVLWSYFPIVSTLHKFALVNDGALMHDCSHSTPGVVQDPYGIEYYYNFSSFPLGEIKTVGYSVYSNKYGSAAVLSIRTHFKDVLCGGALLWPPAAYDIIFQDGLE